MSSKKTVVLVVGMALVVAGTLVAALAADEEPSVDVTVVYGATRSDAKATDVAATVHVVDVEDIQRLPVRDVADLLRTLPGVHVVRQDSRGGATSIFMRGANSNQTLVMVDGVRINNPMNGGVDLGNLTLDQIQRIEVVKGPFTTLYGADAVGGVIYIFTKPGAQVQDEISVGGGSFGTLTARAALGGGAGERGWALSGSWVDTDGSREENSDYRGFTAAGRCDLPLAGGVVTLSGRYQDYDRGVPGSTFFPTPTDRQNYATALGSLTWKREGLSSRDTVRFGMWQEDYTLEYTDWMSAAQVTQADPNYYEANWQHDFLFNRGEVNVGVEWRRFEGDYTDTATGSYNARNDSKAAYAQVQLRPDRNWRVLGGARWQEDDLFDVDPTWRCGVTRLLDEGRAGVWFGYGTAFKAPTFNDLFFPGAGNTDLRPETSRGWEIGAWHEVSNAAHAELVFFHHRFEDLIQWAPDPVTSMWYPMNIGQARTQGTELSFAQQLDEQVNHELGLTLLNWTTNGSPLLRRPDLQFNYSLNYTGERASASLETCYVGRRMDTFGFNTDWGRAYLVFNLSGQYNLDRDTKAWLRVENLFDAQYEAVGGYPSPGFGIYGGVTRAL